MMQAVGGSMLNPVAMSIITNTFTKPAERARAIGVWGGVVGISIALGPLVGGALVASVGWPGIFWVNIPVCVAALVLTALFVPESKAAHARQVDPVGQVLVILTLASLTYGIIEGPNAGWTSPRIISCFVLSAAAAIGLIWYEPRRREPLIDLRFFRSAPFTGATVIAVSAFAALGGFLFLNTLYLQDVRGYSAFHAGLYTLPMAVMTVIFAPLSGRVVGSRGPRLPLIVAGLAMTASGIMLTQLTATTSAHWLIITYLVFGLGFGVVNAPITNTAVSGMPQVAGRRGGGGGLHQPPGRHVAWRRRDGLGGDLGDDRAAADRLHQRQSRRLVDHRRVRRGRPRRRPAHQRPLGPADRGPDGGHVRPGKPPGSGGRALTGPACPAGQSAAAAAMPISENAAPWSSLTTAIFPHGLSHAGRTTLPPSRATAAVVASVSATAK